MLSLLKRFLRLSASPEQGTRPTWRVDREGVVYLPERRVVMRGRVG